MLQISCLFPTHGGLQPGVSQIFFSSTAAWVPASAITIPVDAHTPSCTDTYATASCPLAPRREDSWHASSNTHRTSQPPNQRPVWPSTRPLPSASAAVSVSPSTVGRQLASIIPGPALVATRALRTQAIPPLWFVDVGMKVSHWLSRSVQVLPSW